MKIAFIGLGTMGSPMATRLAKAGHYLFVYDIRDSACANFTNIPNCQIANSPREAARDATVLITMLPESHHTHDAIFGMNGAIESFRPGGIIVEMGTGSVHKLRLVDAPVCRSPKEAETGNLLVMAGGTSKDFNEIMPLLNILADQVTHSGPLGSGLKLKLVNNYMSMIGMVMTAEVLNLAQVLGLYFKETVRVLQSTPAGQGQITTNFPKKVLKGDISADFPLRLGLKDIGLALALAHSEGVPTPLGSASQQIFALVRSWGRANQDCTAMLHLFSDLSGSFNTKKQWLIETL